jgi:hypothetical protein
MPSDDLGAYEDAGQRVDDFLAGVGWQAHMVAPERERLVRLLVALEGLGMPVLVEALESFVDAAQRITGAEFDRQESIGDAAMIVAQVVLFEVAFAIITAAGLSALPDSACRRHHDIEVEQGDNRCPQMDRLGNCGATTVLSAVFTT